jgi:predicted DNA-binding protein (UPF0251 family)
MGRPYRIRRVSKIPNFTYFQPKSDSFKDGFEEILTIAEFEALRLKHFENKSQIECAKLMNISQPTFSRILDLAHKKLTIALIYGKAIRIEGGPIRIKKEFIGYGCLNCMNEWEDLMAMEKDNISKNCPKCNSSNVYFLKKEILLKKS